MGWVCSSCQRSAQIFLAGWVWGRFLLSLASGVLESRDARSWTKRRAGLQGLLRDHLGMMWFIALEWHQEAALGIWAPLWLSTLGLTLSLSLQALPPAQCPC